MLNISFRVRFITINQNLRPLLNAENKVNVDSIFVLWLFNKIINFLHSTLFNSFLGQKDIWVRSMANGSFLFILFNPSRFESVKKHFRTTTEVKSSNKEERICFKQNVRKWFSTKCQLCQCYLTHGLCKQAISDPMCYFKQTEITCN